MERPYELDLLSRLVEIDTDANTKTGYVKCSELIQKEAQELGMRTRVYDSGERSNDKKPRPNVVVDLDVGANETILLATHYDTVPEGTGWKHPPFKMEVVGNRAYGRGTSDDKGAIASALSAMKELSRYHSRVNVSLLATPDEEVGGRLGLGYLVSEVGIRGDAAIVLDTSSEMISIGASGIILGSITVKGKQGHGGYPHMAVNAINLCLPLLQQLRKYSRLRENRRSSVPAPPGSPYKFIRGRFSLTMLRSGEKENIIPGLCEARFDLRVNPDEDLRNVRKDFSGYFRRIVRDQGAKAHLKFIEMNEGYFTDPSERLVKRLSDAVSVACGKSLPLAGELGGNDGRYFAAIGIPVVGFGPSRSDTRFHGVDEFVYVKDLMLVKASIINLCRNW
jgi:succinyl-diaminopimelate desuccinylase